MSRSRHVRDSRASHHSEESFYGANLSSSVVSWDLGSPRKSLRTGPSPSGADSRARLRVFAPSRRCVPDGESRRWGRVLGVIAFRKVAILASLLLGACSAPASAATFVGGTYNGASFTSGVGPFVWNIESSHQSGEYAGLAWRLSTDGVWHLCQESPMKISLSNVGPGVYTIEIADDVSKGWLIEHGASNSSIAELLCRFFPLGPISTDSFTIPKHRDEPGKPSSPRPTITTSPTTSPSSSTVGPAPRASTQPSRACRSGNTAARIGGHSTCLHTGASCLWRYRRQYAHYHYACVRKGRRVVLVRGARRCRFRARDRDDSERETALLRRTQ
jgi:hypothetical protein